MFYQNFVAPKPVRAPGILPLLPPPPLSPALSACINDVENAVNLDAEKFHKRLMANERSLNVAKTEFQLSGTKRNLKNDLA